MDHHTSFTGNDHESQSQGLKTEPLAIFGPRIQAPNVALVREGQKLLVLVTSRVHADLDAFRFIGLQESWEVRAGIDARVIAFLDIVALADHPKHYFLHLIYELAIVMNNFAKMVEMVARHSLSQAASDYRRGKSNQFPHPK